MLKEIFHDSFENFEITRIGMERMLCLVRAFSFQGQKKIALLQIADVIRRVVLLLFSLCF